MPVGNCCRLDGEPQPSGTGLAYRSRSVRARRSRVGSAWARATPRGLCVGLGAPPGGLGTPPGGLDRGSWWARPGLLVGSSGAPGGLERGSWCRFPILVMQGAVNVQVYIPVHRQNGWRSKCPRSRRSAGGRDKAEAPSHQEWITLAFRVRIVRLLSRPQIRPRRAAPRPRGRADRSAARGVRCPP
jgi:hypothetical protein